MRFYKLVLLVIISGSVHAQCNFHASFRLSTDTVCQGLRITLHDSIRYYSSTSDSMVDFWKTPIRYLNNLEVFQADWDSSDGLGPVWERSLVLNHIYDQPGRYTITTVVKDSTNCRDTFYNTVFVLSIESDYEIEDRLDSCTRIIELRNLALEHSDSSYQDEVDQWEWRVNSDTMVNDTLLTLTSFLNESINIELFNRSSFGCIDSTSFNIPAIAPSPKFSIKDMYKDTLKLCVGEAITLINRTTHIDSGSYEISWGNGSTTIQSDDWDILKSPEYTTSGMYSLSMLLNYYVEQSNAICELSSIEESDEEIILVKDLAGADFVISENPTYVGRLVEFTPLVDSSNVSIEWSFDHGEFRITNTPIPVSKEFGVPLNYHIAMNSFFRRGYFNAPYCVSTHDTVLVVLPGESLGLKPIETAITSIAPNPSRGQVHIQSKCGIISGIKVFDSVGNLVDSTSNQTSEQIIYINHPPGVYYLELAYSSGLIERHKIIKQ